MAAGVYSEKGEYDSLFLSNYIDVYVKDALKRVPGVADVIIFGERKYSMRLWLDPAAARGAARSRPATSTSALREQNVQVAAGALGQAPAPAGQMYQLSVRVEGRLPEAVRVRQHHRQGGRRTARSSASRTSATRSSAPRPTARSCASRRATPSASASSSCRRPTRSTSRGDVQSCDRLAAVRTSRRALKYQIALNTTQVVQRLDSRKC